MTTTVNEPARQLREWIGEMFVHQRDADEVIRILDAALADERAIGAEALDCGTLAAIIEDTPAAVINSALMDSGEGLAGWIVGHWAEYAELQGIER